MKAASRSHPSAPEGGVTSAPNGTPGPTMFLYCGLIIARAPSSADRASDGSNLSSWPVAHARSQEWAASSPTYISTRVAPSYSSPHGIVNFDDNASLSAHAAAASLAAERSCAGASASSM